ncbi:MAG: helix-turn-helix domain-containing protein [Vicinamibacteria bacterium]
MKNKSYYEILGVAPHVGSGQIQAAYRFTRSLYSGEATPTYGLLGAEERVQMLALVEEAYAALSNPNVRRDYDIHLAAQGGRTAAPRPAPANAEPPPTSVAQPPPTSVAEPVPQPRPMRDPEGDPVERSVEEPRVPEMVDGAVLKSLREARRLSIEQIAALSKIGARFLRALEEDRHGVLPGRVFARGFLIEYARAIRVPEAEIVDRYLKHWTGK